MKAYILMLYFVANSTGNSPASSMQEFLSKDSCEFAKAQYYEKYPINDWLGNFTGKFKIVEKFPELELAICVPK